MDLDDFLPDFFEMNCNRNRMCRQSYRLRGVEVSNPPPTAERILQRKAEQERRRRQVLANQIDLNMQGDLMAEFEESLKAPKVEDKETNESRCA